MLLHSISATIVEKFLTTKMGTTSSIEPITVQKTVYPERVVIQGEQNTTNLAKCQRDKPQKNSSHVVLVPVSISKLKGHHLELTRHPEKTYSQKGSPRQGQRNTSPPSLHRIFVENESLNCHPSCANYLRKSPSGLASYDLAVTQ